MASDRDFFVYLLASTSRVLYIGCTSDLSRRVYQHRHGLLAGFTRTYRVRRLVYFEQVANARVAVVRERQLKGWARWKKVRLIEGMNPTWADLARDWF